MSTSNRRASAFPRGGRRLIVLTVFDRRGAVDDVLAHALVGLREHAAEIVAVVNGELSAAGGSRLAELADRVIRRDNRGFDIGAQQEALALLGDSVEDFDEVVLTNDTWYGPLGSFAPLFARMDAQATDFWGLTAHGDHDGIPRHLQSYWIAARRSLTSTPDWRDYWRGLPVFDAYWDAVFGHETVFTAYFENRGFTSAVAFPEERYAAGNAAMTAPAALIADGLPLLKKRVFFHDPTVLARRGVDPGRVIEVATEAGYPPGLLWSHLARTVPARALHAACGLIEILPTAPVMQASAHESRTLVIAHVPSSSSLSELAERAGALPGRWDLVLTPTEDLPDICDLGAAARLFPTAETIAVEPHAGGDERGTVAFFDSCSRRPISEWELVLAVSAPGCAPPSTSARREGDLAALDAMLDGRASVSALLAQFRAVPWLGAVFPLPPVDGDDPDAAAWGDERAIVEALLLAAGIEPVLDAWAPLEPAHGMWIARSSVLRPIVEHIADPAVAHAPVDVRARALRRTLAASAGAQGLHVRTAGSERAVRRTLALRDWQAENNPGRARPDASEPAAGPAAGGSPPGGDWMRRLRNRPRRRS